jgi:hypothetical protein
VPGEPGQLGEPAADHRKPAATTSGLGYREWTVTAHVQAMYQGPNHGFLIRDALENTDAEQQFHSREKGENPPQPVITFG